MHGRLITDEIETQIQQGKGCIIFDFGMYFPYCLNEGDEVIFRFGLGNEHLPDIKLNHRYTNKNYYTITKKLDSGRLSKVGYPYFFDLEDEPFLAILCVTIGIRRDGKDKTTDCLFPLSVQLTKERPVCGLSLKFNYENGKIAFSSHEYDGRGWKTCCWTSEHDEAEGERLKWLSPVPVESELGSDDKAGANALKRVTESTIVFEPAITPIPQKPDELLVL